MLLDNNGVLYTVLSQFMTLAFKSNELLDLLISLSGFPVTFFFLQKHINAKYENTLCSAIKSSIIQIHNTISYCSAILFHYVIYASLHLIRIKRHHESRCNVTKQFLFTRQNYSVTQHFLFTPACLMAGWQRLCFSV